MDNLDRCLKDFAVSSDGWFKENGQMVKSHYDFIKKFFDKDNLKKLTWESIQELGDYIHAFNSLALAKTRALGKPNHDLSHYINTFTYFAHGGGAIEERINNIEDDTKYNIKYFGPAVWSELAGNYFSDEFILMNSRDKEAFGYLGLSYSESSNVPLGTRLANFSNSLENFRAKYNSIVGSKFDIPINLQIDQFFSYVYVNYVDRDLKNNSKYWLAGTYWRGDSNEDKTNDFIDNGVWLNGFTENSGDPSIEMVKKVKSGDLIALKGSSTKGENRSISFTKIKAIGEVQENFGDGVKLKVKWTYTGPAFDLDGYGYRKTFERARPEHIEAIFKRDLSVKQTLSDETFHEIVKSLEPNKYKFFLDLLREVIANFGLKHSDTRIVFSSKRKKLSFTVGQRYCLSIVSVEQNVTEIGIITSSSVSSDSERFDGKTEAYFTYFSDLNELSKFKANCLEAIANELERTTTSGFYKHDDKIFRNYVFGVESLSSNIGKNMKLINELNSLNTILYGPPGTGKTYKLLQFQEHFESNSNNNKDRMVSWIQELGWWEVVAATLIDINKPVTVPVLFEHEFIQTKIKQSANKTPKNTIWGMLQAHTVRESKTVNYKERQEPLVVEKTTDSLWQLVGDWKNELDDLVKAVALIRNDDAVEVEKYYSVVTFHQSYSYEEFVEGIRPERSPDGSGISYQVKDGVFKLICQRAEANPDNNYALFIDEINRGNISKIFGELITLIEPDKRKGAEHEVSVTLPYSGKQFSVPKNLYIIGTMNSVDRSIALVDMALRRRFNFVSIKPNPELINPPIIETVNIRSIFEKLNSKIAVILGSEYQIGHSYFMGERANSLSALKRTWFGSVLPLLQEYLFDDWDKLEALVKEFVIKRDVKELENLALPKFSYGSFVESNINDAQFKELLRKLE